MISPVFKGPMSQPAVSQSYEQAGAIAGATAAMQARAAQIQVCMCLPAYFAFSKERASATTIDADVIGAFCVQRAKVAGYLLKPMYTTP